MRLLTVTVVAAILVAACATEPVPRHPSVYVPPSELPATPAPTADGAPTDAAAEPSADHTTAPGGATVDTSAWEQVSPDGERFVIRMPAKPSVETGTVDTPGGKASRTTWSVTDAGGRAYAMTRVRGPMPPATHQAAMFDEVVKGLQTAMTGSKATSQTDVTVGGNAARRIVLESADTRAVCLVLVAGADMLTPCVVSATSVADDGSTDAFLNSLTVKA